jgi:hypothetical protein
MDKYSASTPYNYCNGICDSATDCGHCLWAPENGYIHWSEGWPDFFADVQAQYWGRDDLYGFESHNDWGYTNVDMIEGFTAAILWDIYDSASDNQHNDYPRDNLSLGFGQIWNVTTNYNTGGQYIYPATIHEFFDAFYDWYPEYRQGLCSVYAEHHIIKDKCVDLIVQSITTNPTTPFPNENVTVTVTVENQGVVAAVSFYLDIYKNRDTAPTVGVYGDTWCNITAGLAAGATTTCVQ